MLRIRSPGFLLKLCHKTQLALSSFILLLQFVKLRSSLQADRVHGMVFTMCFEILRQKVLHKCKNIIIIQLAMSSTPKQNEAGNLYLASNLLNRFPCLCYLNSTSMEQDKIEHLAHSCSPNFFSSCCFFVFISSSNKNEVHGFFQLTDTPYNVKHFVHKENILLSRGMK